MGSAGGDAMMQVVEDSTAFPHVAVADRGGTVFYSASGANGFDSLYRTGSADPVVIADRGMALRVMADGRSIVFWGSEMPPKIMRMSIDARTSRPSWIAPASWPRR
jgi:hypothetical protein